MNGGCSFDDTVASLGLSLDLLVGLGEAGQAFGQHSHHSGTDHQVQLVVHCQLDQLVGVGQARVHLFHYQLLSFQNVFPPRFITVVVSTTDFQFDQSLLHQQILLHIEG